MSHPATKNQPILIVEDSDDDFEVTERALKRSKELNNPIYRCASGQQALDFLRHQGSFADPQDAPRPGIILLDLNMPGRDGREVLAELKSDEFLKDIPVVILTTSSDSVDIRDCYDHGANSFVTKPVGFEGAMRAVQSIKEYWFNTSTLPKVERHD